MVQLTPTTWQNRQSPWSSPTMQERMSFCMPEVLMLISSLAYTRMPTSLMLSGKCFLNIKVLCFLIYSVYSDYFFSSAWSCCFFFANSSSLSFQRARLCDLTLWFYSLLVFFFISKELFGQLLEIVFLFLHL